MAESMEREKQLLLDIQKASREADEAARQADIERKRYQGAVKETKAEQKRREKVEKVARMKKEVLERQRNVLRKIRADMQTWATTPRKTKQRGGDFVDRVAGPITDKYGEKEARATVGQGAYPLPDDDPNWGQP